MYVAAMPKISAAAAARRRSHILDAARQCFAEHGIHVSVDEICARAAVSKGAFYGYFDSKDAAIEAIAQDHAQRVVNTFALLDSPEALIERLTQHTTGRDINSLRLELETYSYALKLPSLRTALQHNVESLRQALATSLATLSGDGKAPASPAVCAEILTFFCMGLIASSALGPERTSRSANAALKALVAALLGTRPAQAGRRPPARSVSG